MRRKRNHRKISLAVVRLIVQQGEDIVYAFLFLHTNCEENCDVQVEPDSDAGNDDTQTVAPVLSGASSPRSVLPNTLSPEATTVVISKAVDFSVPDSEDNIIFMDGSVTVVKAATFSKLIERLTCPADYIGK